MKLKQRPQTMVTFLNFSNYKIKTRLPDSLFIVVIEILPTNIRHNKNIKGIKEVTKR